MSQIVVSDIVSLRDRWLLYFNCRRIAKTIHAHHRGKYQGIIGSVVAIGYAIGPVIGGALAQKVTWRVRNLSCNCYYEKANI